MGNALNHQANKNDPTGFQVTTVQPLSPGADCGLKCNEDFIIKLNGKTVSATDPNLIMGLVQNSINRPVTLQVFNTKTQKVREVKLTPSSNWPGEGLLGITMKLNRYKPSKAPKAPKSPKSVRTLAFT
eukprot:gene15040-17240_t